MGRFFTHLQVLSVIRAAEIGKGGGQAEMSRSGLWFILLFHSIMGLKLYADLPERCLMNGILDLSCCGQRASAAI